MYVATACYPTEVSIARSTATMEQHLYERRRRLQT